MHQHKMPKEQKKTEELNFKVFGLIEEKKFFILDEIAR